MVDKNILLLAVVVLAYTTTSCIAQPKRPPAPKRPPSPNPCNAYPIDVKQTWVVTDTISNFYRPGNTTERGPLSISDASNYRYSIFVNDSFPGPTLEVNKGDWVRIDVINMLLNTLVSIHWHGIDQRGTPWADGTVMITSCPIPAMMGGGNNSFSYIWQANEAGTFWWHGHVGLEHEYGVAGSIVIKDPADPFLGLYDLELPAGPIMVNDWWRDPNGQYALVGQFGFYANLDLALINGHYGNGSPSLPYNVVGTVQQGLCYRLRIVNGNSEWAGWEMSVDPPEGGTNYLNMTLIAVDSVNIRPVNVRSLTIYAAERADVIVCADGPAGDHLLSFRSTQSGQGNCNYYLGCQNVTQAILRVVPRSSNITSKANRTRLAAYPYTRTVDSMTDLLRMKPYIARPPPASANQTLNLKMGVTTDHAYLWTERGAAFQVPTAPPLFTKNTCGVTPASVTHTVENGTVVDLVIDNLMSSVHPFHTHGHQMWLLGSGFYVNAIDSMEATNQTLCPGRYQASLPFFDGAIPPPIPLWGCPYNATTDARKLNYVDPPITDTVIVPSRGWVVVRMVLNNPGQWFFHCHFNHHMLLGMGFIMNVGPDQQPTIPGWVNTRCSGECAPAVEQKCGPYSPPASKQAQCVARGGQIPGYCRGE